MTVKVTNIFTQGTLDSEGNPQRTGGWTENLYSMLPIDSSTLQDQWTSLCNKRAALLPRTAYIAGGRYANVDPAGGSRSYDNVFKSTSTAAGDLPGVALQYTVRSSTTFNERSLVLPGVPDGRVQNGEYIPEPTYDAALLSYFRELRANWRFRCIDRTILPIKIVNMDNQSVVTTATPHGLAQGNTATLMSIIIGDRAPVTLDVLVLEATVTTFKALLPRQYLNTAGHGGRVRRKVVQYVQFSITNEEILSPNVIHRKVGRPSKAFRGRRTARHI